MCVTTMAPIDGDVEIVENTIDEVLSESARPTVSAVESISREQEGRNQEREGVEIRVERLEGRLGVLEGDIMSLRRECSERKAEIETLKWEVSEAMTRIEHVSDWSRSQIRGNETYIGRVRRETFDCRLKFKREIEKDVRDYLGNIDSQLDRIRTRMTGVEGEIWPMGDGPRMKELHSQLGTGEADKEEDKHGEDLKRSEGKEKEWGGGKWGKGKGKWWNVEEREKKSEATKVIGKGGADAVREKEEWRGKPYRTAEEDGYWWVPISNEEWTEWHEKETFRCKEGGWWTKMRNDRYEEWQDMRDRRG